METKERIFSDWRMSGKDKVQNISVPCTFSKTTRLHLPHYTDKRFDQAQIVFGRNEKGLEWVYDDRLWQWDYEKHKEAVAEAEDGENQPRTAAWYEDYLCAYFGKQVELICVRAGCNLSSGYPYYVFGYRDMPDG